MSLRSIIATAAGKSSYWFLHNIMHGGTAFPGEITTKIDPDILKSLGKNYRVVIVTGTNGKTLTTSLIVRALKQKYPHILTNPSGSNMKRGIVTTFLKGHHHRKGSRPLAILEVDEAYVIQVVKYIKPIAFVLTNIFRDQLDRYSEIYYTYDLILKAIKLAPKATIIANGDDSLFQSVNLPNPVVYYGFANHDEHLDFKAKPNTDDVICPRCHHILHYHYITYANLGDYFCPNCGYARPKLTTAVTKIDKLTPDTSEFEIDHHKLTIEAGGTYNIYNALTAYAVAKFFGVDDDKIIKAFRTNAQIFGRQEKIDINNRQIILIMIKNKVSVNVIFDMLAHEKNPFSFAFLLSSKNADGLDTSYMWDCNFEKVVKMHPKQFISGGDHYKDIAYRMKVAGAPDDKHIVAKNYKELIHDLANVPTKKVYVVACYTPMRTLRGILAEKGYVKKGLDWYEIEIWITNCPFIWWPYEYLRWLRKHFGSAVLRS